MTSEPRNRPILFHIGLPKCGSTSLQENVFAKSKQVDFWTAEIVDGKYSKDQVLNAFLLEQLCAREVQLSDLARNWNLFKATRKEAPGRIVISEEMLSSIGHYRDLSARIAALEPDAEILLIIRPRAALLRSLYDMRPLDFWNNNKRFVKFDLWLKKIIDTDVHGNFVHVLEYGHIVEAFVRHFGSARVHVFTLKELSSVDDRIVSFLFDRFGVTREILTQALADGQKNSAELHLAKKALRRLMGPVHASWFLNRRQIEFLTRLMSKAPGMKRTEMTEAQAAAIERRFASDQALLLEQFPQEVERFVGY